MDIAERMFEERGLPRVQRYVRQPSISADGTGIGEMAELLVGEIEDLGGSARRIETAGHPVVYGELDAGAPVTLLLYGMYDVQPVEGEKWLVEPFAAEVVDLPGHGPSVVGRGVYNTKGPLAGFMDALHAAKEAGSLPVNVRFLIEGEEELQSKHLKDVVRDNRELLSAADHAYFPFYSEDPAGKPLVNLGVKGIMFFELVSRGGEQGGPTQRDVHGSNAVWFGNPAWDLVQALATMTTPDQKHILIDGFYDEVDPPSLEDEELLEQLEGTVSPETELETNGVKRFKYDLTGTALLRKYLYQPTLNIDGIVGGHHGAGTKTVVPHEARAKMDVRMVPSMAPERVKRLVREHLDRRGFGHVEMVVNDAYPWAKTPASNPAVGAMLRAMRTLGHEPEVWPHLGGSAPFYLFTKELGLPLAAGGLGHGGRPHSPNEYATVEGMRRFEASVLHFLYNLGEET